MKKLITAIAAAVVSLVGYAEDPAYSCQAVNTTKADSKNVSSAQSWDPNEMSGPAGVGAQRYVKPGETMDYTIYFENQTNATAAAIKIAVTLPKDVNLDWSTLELGEIVFGDHTDTGLVEDKSARSSVFPLAGTGCEVRTAVTATDDAVTWSLRIWDPNTPDHFPDDFDMGILPPNDPDTHCGEGRIAYRVKLRDDIASGTIVRATASIVFDDNLAIVTDPAWWNTVAQIQTVEIHDGEGVVDMQDLIVGMPYGENLPAAPAPRTGYTFGGWWTAPGGPNGMGRHVMAQSLVQADDSGLYAHWTANRYTVTFNANGGEGEMPDQSFEFDKPGTLDPNAFTRASYWFIGWATNETADAVYEDGATVTNLTAEADGVVDLFAVWEVVAMEVSFDLNYADELKLVPPVVVTNGVAYGVLPVAERTGYSFAGWTNGRDARSPSVVATTVVTNVADHTLYAQWKVNKYRVTFDANDGDGGAAVDLAYGAAITAPVVTREGYTFKGWSPAIPMSVPASNATYVAQWQVNKYKVTFDANGGDGGVSGEFDYGSGVTPPVVSRNGYTFIGWDASVSATVSASDVIYKANWLANAYTVRFNANGGEGMMSDQAFEFDKPDTLDANAFTRTSYRYLGWATNETGSVVYEDGATVTNLTAEVDGVVNLFAVWEVVAMEVAFDLNCADATSASLPSIVVTNSVAYGALPIPTRRGYSFVGWTNGRDARSPSVVATTIVTNVADHALYAQWNANKYNVTFNANGGSMGTASPAMVVTYGVAYGTLPTPTRTGYSFVGWTNGRDSRSPSVAATTVVTNVADHTLYAQWKANAYTIKYDANGGDGEMSAFAGTYDKAAGLASNAFTRVSYRFAGWAASPDGEVVYGDGVEVSNLTSVAGGVVTLYAVWELKTVPVAFDAQGGEPAPTNRVYVEEAPYGELPDVARLGYTFGGWYTGPNGTGMRVTVQGIVTPDVVKMYACWLVNAYTVRFNANGGEGVMSGQAFEFNVAGSLDANAFTRTGYRFVGWAESPNGAVAYGDGATVSNLTAEADGVVELFAVWEVVAMEVSFDANGGSLEAASPTMVVTYGVAYGALPTPTRTGYSFVGWTNGRDARSPSVVATTIVTNVADHTLYAQWEKIVYAVSFVESDVSVDEGGTATVRVSGGSAERASTVKVYLTYQSATAADLDLAKGSVQSQANLKFPITLAWSAGEIGERTITIPVKADRAVEADEVFTLQLADEVGVEMGEANVCTVTIKDPGYAALGAKVADGSATKAETTQWNKLQRNGAFYIRGLADPADGGKVTGSALCAEGKKMTLKATAAKGFRLVGWSDGKKTVATTASLVIDRTAKPAANTKTSTTLTGVNGDTTYYAVFEGDPRVTAVLVDSSGANMGAGKVTGTGRYAEGKKVTVKATANKGYIFSKWLDAEGNELSQLASYSFAMPGREVNLTAKFITTAEDAAAIALSVGGKAMKAGDTAKWTLRCGVAVDWPVTAAGLSATTVKAAGLPAGLKLVQDRVTKAYSVTGAPTAASKADKSGNVTPSKVKFTVTTAGKSKQEFQVAMTVLPLPEWAQGTFNGVVASSQNCAGEDARSPSCLSEVAGLVPTLTVAASGKISGKIVAGGVTWTLSAAAFDSVDGSQESEVGSPQFRATLIGKAGKSAFTNVVTVARGEVGVPDSVNGRGARSPRGVVTAAKWTAWQNLWKDEPWKTAAKPFGKAPAVETAAGVSLKFAASGAVTAKYNGYSCSTALIPVEGNEYEVFVYFPPKGTFAGYGAVVPLVWDGAAFSEKK